MPPPTIPDLTPLPSDSPVSATELDAEVGFDERLAILYALALGLGEDAAPAERAYLQPMQHMAVVPTLVSAVLDDGPVASRLGRDSSEAQQLQYNREQLTLYRPPLARAVLKAKRRLQSTENDGLRLDTELRNARDETVIASCTRSYAVAADSTGLAARAEQDRVPGRSPDLVCSLKTHANQAILYSLFESFLAEGAAPKLTDASGLPAGFVHGLACRALLQTICSYDYTLIGSFDLSFVAPLFPGDELITEMWQDGNVVRFRCLEGRRGTVVASGGSCELRA